MSEWRRLIANVMRALTGMKRSDISEHIPHHDPTARYQWTCPNCRTVNLWERPQCIRCSHQRPPIVAPDAS